MVFTDATNQAYANLRSLDNFQWYVIPLLVIVILLYSNEVRKKNWNRVICGLAFFGGEFIWEMTNALICYGSNYSGLWLTPGDTAYLILVGLNIEIAFFFALIPLIIFNFLDAFQKEEKIKLFGKEISNRLIIPLILGLLCVFVEVLLNQWGALVWEWSWWNWPFIPLIIIAYTLPIYLITWVYDHKTLNFKIKATILIFVIAITMFIVFSNLSWI
ncbi:MAG TPA: hypothetical protein VMV49_04375 [Candidatus Deferrimicrobium sp.]|nr:hypothetical protein [Candidatus Deferrimicrobium sp.]